MAAVILLATGACKKSDTTANTSGKSTWTLGGTSYTTVFSYRNVTGGGSSNTLLSFYDSIPSGSNPNVNSVNFTFNTAPTASGTYQLSGTVGGTLTATQCELSAGGAGKSYAYIGTPVNITVTVTGGKITIVVPEITLKSTVSGTADAKLSASVTEI